MNKLVCCQLSGGESQKHLRDIGGMLKLLGEKLDRTYVVPWAEILGVTEPWQLILDRLREQDP